MKFSSAIMLMVIGLLVISFLSPVTYASEGSSLSIEVKDTYITIENNYYKITVNLTMGARIIEWTIKGSNPPIDLVQSDTFMPSLSFITYTNNVKQNFTVTVENKTIVIQSYPLLFSKWNAQVLEQKDDHAIILFTPPPEALSQVDPLFLKVVWYVYNSEPYVDIYYTLENPTNSPVYLSKIKGDVDFYLDLTVYLKNMKIDEWNETISYIDLRRDEVTSKADIQSGYYDIILRNKQLNVLGVFDNTSKLVSIISPMRENPIQGEVYRKIVIGNESFDGLVYSLGYSIGEIKPKSEAYVGVRLMYNMLGACSLYKLNAEYLYKVTNPNNYNVYNLYKENFPQEISKLNSTVNGLREARDNLLKKIDELNNEVNYWKGNATYWKTEWSIVKESINGYVNDAKRAQLISVVGAILGLILGFIGGMIFYKKR